MVAPKNKRKHDVIHAVRVLASLVDFIDEGIDFSSEDGKDILAEARQAKAFLEKEVGAIFENESTQ